LEILWINQLETVLVVAFPPLRDYYILLLTTNKKNKERIREEMKKWKSKKFNIFGDKWTIVFVDKVLDNRGPEDPEHWLFGESTSLNKKIRISTKKPDDTLLSDNEVLNTVAHECVHAILDSGQYLKSSGDEPMVEFLAKGILSLLKNKVFEYEDEKSNRKKKL
jgi:hypothetical protein